MCKCHLAYQDSLDLNIHEMIVSVILGNAYLSLFFSGGQDPRVLKQCMSAYSQAVSIVTSAYAIPPLLMLECLAHTRLFVVYILAVTPDGMSVHMMECLISY